MRPQDEHEPCLAMSEVGGLASSGNESPVTWPRLAVPGVLRGIERSAKSRYKQKNQRDSQIYQPLHASFLPNPSPPAHPSQQPVAGEYLNGGFYGGRAADLELALRLGWGLASPRKKERLARVLLSLLPSYV